MIRRRRRSRRSMEGLSSNVDESAKVHKSTRRTSISTSMNTSTSTRSLDKNEAAKVVAATAGEDSWKTWANRQEGSSDFEWNDLWRGTKRMWQSKWTSVSYPSHCPVCYNTEPPVTSSTKASKSQSFWHVTSACRHVVCVHCFRAYAASQVRDPLHTGPLKCPVCPQVLRQKDAIQALLLDDNDEDEGDVDMNKDSGGHNYIGNNNNNNCHDNTNANANKDRHRTLSLVDEWDAKLRNQLLRALPSYRPCPRCSSNTHDDDDAKIHATHANHNITTGGGFVTTECLTEQYRQRQEEATRIFQWGVKGGFVFAFLYVCYFTSYILNTHPSSSAMTDMICILIICVTTIHPNSLYFRRHAAYAARELLIKPIPVECPNCDEEFILPNEDTTISSTIQDFSSQEWMKAHTRPCPKCHVPIVKASGCNHMKCQHCHIDFCWACMRVKTKCRAYKCQHGGVDATPPSPLSSSSLSVTMTADGLNGTESLMDRLDRVLQPILEQPTTAPSPPTTSTTMTNGHGNGNRNSSVERDDMEHSATETRTTGSKLSFDDSTQSPKEEDLSGTNSNRSVNIPIPLRINIIALAIGLFVRHIYIVQQVIEVLVTVFLIVHTFLITTSWLGIGVLVWMFGRLLGEGGRGPSSRHHHRRRLRHQNLQQGHGQGNGHDELLINYRLQQLARSFPFLRSILGPIDDDERNGRIVAQAVDAADVAVGLDRRHNWWEGISTMTTRTATTTTTATAAANLEQMYGSEEERIQEAIRRSLLNDD